MAEAIRLFVWLLLSGVVWVCVLGRVFVGLIRDHRTRVGRIRAVRPSKAVGARRGCKG